MEEFYCSNCNNPVKEDEKICPHCGADLSETVENVDEQNSVIIKTFVNMVEAETAQEYLENCGIDSYLSKDDAGGMYPHHFGGINSFKLIVLESNVEKTLKALEALENGSAELDDDTEGK